MAERIKIKEVIVDQQGSVYRYTGDDGYPAAAVRDGIIAVVEDGRHFYLSPWRAMTAEEKAREAEDDWYCPGPPPSRWHAYQQDDFIAAIRERGTLDPTIWVEFEPDTRSLEERWADDAEREATDRLYGLAG